MTLNEPDAAHFAASVDFQSMRAFACTIFPEGQIRIQIHAPRSLRIRSLNRLRGPNSHVRPIPRQVVSVKSTAPVTNTFV